MRDAMGGPGVAMQWPTMDPAERERVEAEVTRAVNAAAGRALAMMRERDAAAAAAAREGGQACAEEEADDDSSSDSSSSVSEQWGLGDVAGMVGQGLQRTCAHMRACLRAGCIANQHTMRVSNSCLRMRHVPSHTWTRVMERGQCSVQTTTKFLVSSQPTRGKGDRGGGEGAGVVLWVAAPSTSFCSQSHSLTTSRS